MANTYVIYYGWLTDDERGEPNATARRIAAARAPLLIAQFRTAVPQRHVNLSPHVIALMRDAGTDVCAYVPTRWGEADDREVMRAVSEYLSAGVDGIFFDEADTLLTASKVSYYAALSRRVRDQGKKVIVNTGRAQCGETIMEIADRLMVEHQWRDLGTCSLWVFRYEAARFMGVSSNESNVMGYTVDAARAIGDTREAWQQRIGWHASTDRFIELPEWFEDYMAAVK